MAYLVTSSTWHTLAKMEETKNEKIKELEEQIKELKDKAQLPHLQGRIKEQRRELKLKNLQVSELKELVCKLTKLKEDYNQFRIDRIPLLAQLEQTTADCEKAIEAYRHFKGENDKLMEKLNASENENRRLKGRADKLDEVEFGDTARTVRLKSHIQDLERIISGLLNEKDQIIRVGDKVEIINVPEFTTLLKGDIVTVTGKEGLLYAVDGGWCVNGEQIRKVG